MANEQQYYNPIIQAMVANVQAQQNQQKLEQQQEQQKQEIAASKLQGGLAQQTQKREETRLANEHDYQMEMLKIHHEMQAGQLKHMQIEDLKSARDASASGVDIPAALASGAPAGAGIPNSEQAQQIDVNRTGALAQATSAGTQSGEDPFLAQRAEQAHQYKVEDESTAAAHRMDLSVQQGQNALEAAKIHGSYMQSVAGINGANHIRGIIAMHQLGMDDGSGQQASQARDLIDGIYNGNIQFSKLSGDQKKAVSAYATSNGEMAGLPTDGAAYTKKLDMLSKFQTYISQFRQLANEYSADAPGATGKGNLNVNLGPLGTHGFVAPGTDLKSRMDDLKTIGGDLAKNLEGQSRTSEADNLRQIIGKFDPMATKAENNQKLDSQVQRMQPIVRNTFGGMTTDRINKVLGDKGITDFGAFQPRVFEGPNGHNIETHDNGRTYLDSITKQPVNGPPPVQ